MTCYLKVIPRRLMADLSAETTKTRKQWDAIVKVLKEKNYQQRILYPTKLSFKYESELKTLSDTKPEKICCL